MLISNRQFKNVIAKICVAALRVLVQGGASGEFGGDEDEEEFGGEGFAQVRAPVTGTVWEVAAAVGTTVAAGQKLLVLEAMKMEYAVTAPTAGTQVPTSFKTWQGGWKHKQHFYYTQT